MANTENDIIEIVAKQAKVDSATLKSDTRIADLKLESIDVIELIFAIEDKFDIEVPYSPNDINAQSISFDTIGDLVAAVEKLSAEQHAK